MVMIFSLVTAVQERLNEIVDLMKNRREEEKRQKEKEAEEAEKVMTGLILVTFTITCSTCLKPKVHDSRCRQHIRLVHWIIHILYSPSCLTVFLSELLDLRLKNLHATSLFFFTLYLLIM